MSVIVVLEVEKKEEEQEEEEEEEEHAAAHPQCPQTRHSPRHRRCDARRIKDTKQRRFLHWM
jgi:hypothetical protein